MSDNFEADAGSGGDIFGADDIGGIKYPRSKLIHGADGVNDGDVSSANPLPVETSLGKAEDAVHVTGDTGVMALGVRNDIIGSLVGADGDYTPLQINSSGAIYTTPGNTISTNNSTTTPLDVDAVYTGTADDCHDFSGITILLDSSHDSATDGISIEFSTDGTNWDNVRTYTFDVSVTPSFVATLPVYGRYFRLVYTNGGTLQTHFRVQTILHSNLVLQPSYRLSDSESPELSGVLTKSATIAQVAGSGLFVPVQATSGGNLKMSLDEVSNGMDVGAGNAGTETLRVSVSTDDVNLSAIKKSISGPAGPTIDSYSSVAINLTTGANQVLVSSAASKQIWVYGYGFTCGDADGQSVSLQDEDDTALTGIMEFAQYGGISVPPSGNFAMPLFKLGTDKDLEIDITAGDVDGWLTYAIVSV